MSVFVESKLKKAYIGESKIKKIYLGENKVWVASVQVALPTFTQTLTYNGGVQTPSFVGYDSSQLTISGDISATNAGSYVAKFTPKEGYSWGADGEDVSTKEVAWSIGRKSISGATITLGSALTYNGSEQTKAVSSVDIDGLTATFTVSGDKQTNAGNYTLTCTGTGNFSGTQTASWSIATKSISGATITLDGSKTYNGSAQTQGVSSVVIGGLDATFTVSGNIGTNATSYTLTCTGTGNFSGTQTKAWSIAKLSLTIPSLSNNSKTYNGSAQNPTVNNFNSTWENQSGTASSTNVGSWTVTWSLKDTSNTQWSDGTTTNKTSSWSIARASVGAKPGTTTSANYTGSAISNGYTKPSGVNVSGSTSGTNAGTYSATYTPDGNHCWSDGTYGAVTRTLTINKIAGSLTLSATSGSVEVGSTVTFTVTRSGDGAISVSSSNTSIATVSLSGTTVTVKAVAKGSATITVKVAAGTNYNVPSDKTYTVSVARLPSSYQEVEYIQSSGLQYIDINYIGKSTTIITTKLMVLSSSYAFLLGSCNVANNYFAVSYGDSVQGYRFEYGEKHAALTSPINAVANIVIQNGKLTVDGTDKAVDSRQVTSGTMYLFCRHGGRGAENKSSMRLYSMQINEGSSLKHDYVPCYRKSDNVIGLYDMVSNTFFTNAGTGSFTVGSNV